MDSDELNRFLRSSGVDLWTLIDASIVLAAKEHAGELRQRRESIIRRIYSPISGDTCRNCDVRNGPVSISSPNKSASPISPKIVDEEEQKSRILGIKEFLDDPDQSEDCLVRLLQNLVDMDISFRILKETDIGRNVNGLRKHTSNEVRVLVKHLVRKWKETVDEWVKTNSGNDAASPAAITDSESPQQASSKQNRIGNQVQDFVHSPQAHNGYLSSERNNTEPILETKVRPIPPRREAPAKQSNYGNHSNTPSSTTPVRVKDQKTSLIDPERLASARKRLHENYQEVENAKKQRTIQVMDIHDIPKKSKNSVGRKGSFQSKHW